MSEIPQNEVTKDTIAQWYNASVALAKAKVAEMTLRMTVFKGLFKAPIEGTNRHVMGDGFDLKIDHKINRKVLAPVLQTLAPSLREQGVPVDKLIKWVPELEMKEYRSLTEEQRKLFDQVLEIKPGTPGMEIVTSKKGS